MDPSFQDIEVPEEVFGNVLISFHLKCLRSFGYIISTKQRFKRFHLTKGVVFIASFIVFFCLDLIRISRGFDSLDDGAKCYATSFTFLSISIATINAYFQRKRVVRMVIFLHKDITELFRVTDKEEELMLDETVKYIHIISGLLFGSSILAAFIVYVDTVCRTLLAPETVFNMPAILNGTAQPILIFQLLPFGEVYDNFIVYYFGAVFAVFISITTLPGWHTFITCLIKYIVLKYDIINKRLKNYDLAKFSLTISHEELQFLPEKELQFWHRKMYGFCIREQAKIRWFTKELESLLKVPVFMDFITFSVLMCFLYFAILEGNPSNMDYIFLGMYAFAMLFLLWLYHWHATLITKGNDELHFALYCCPWYTFPVNIQKNILLMMMESSKPLQMKAIFVEMNLKTFIDVIRGAYSYFSILKNANLEK